MKEFSTQFLLILVISAALLSVHCGESYTTYQSDRPARVLLDKGPSGAREKLEIGLKVNNVSCESMQLEACAHKLLGTWKAEIATATEDKTCTFTSDCESVAIGQSSCGTHSEYKSYSTQNLLKADFLNFVADFNDINDLYQQAYQQDKNLSCQFVARPVLSCENSICVNTSSK